MMSKCVMLLTLSGSQGLLGFHKCPEGNRCVYTRGGALLDTLNHPGWHWHEPFLTSHTPIQITWQTDRLDKVVCGSSKGGTAFLDIEVINKLSEEGKCIQKVIKGHTVDYDKPLIFDYVPSEVAQFCKSYDLDALYIGKFDDLDEILLTKLRENVESYGLTDCLEIKGVRIGRPHLTREMEDKFAMTELLKKDQEHERERAKTQEITLKTELAKARADAERVQTTAKIEMETKRLEAQNGATIQEIENEKERKRIESEAKAKGMALEMEAKANQYLLTPEYLQLQHDRALLNNAKIHTIDGKAMEGSLFHLGSRGGMEFPYSKESQTK